MTNHKLVISEVTLLICVQNKQEKDKKKPTTRIALFKNK